MAPSRLAPLSVIRCNVGDQDDPEYSDEDDEHYRAEIGYVRRMENLLDSVSPCDCIAMRHASLAVATFVRAVDHKDFLRCYDEEDHEFKPFSQRILITVIELQPIASHGRFGYLKFMLDQGKQDPERRSTSEKKMNENALSYIKHLGITFHRYLHNDAKRLPERHSRGAWNPQPHITKKIRDIYLNWDTLDIKERQSIIRNFQIKEDDEDKARELVKSFVLTDYDTPSWRSTTIGCGLTT